MRRTLSLASAAMLFFAPLEPALAGPPYLTDDPEPTDTGHYEIYLFAGGSAARTGNGVAGGIDFNYGAAPDLQLTAVVPLAWSDPATGRSATGLGNVELAAKYKFLHQDDVGVDVAFFPRVFLPAGTSAVGERHVSLLLPLWIGRSWGAWSAFGGGGCTLDRGGGAQSFCEFGGALTRDVAPGLNVGAEIYHQGAGTVGGRASTYLGFGATFDLNENLHVMASGGPGIQNPAATGRYTWYAALLATF